MRLEVPGDGLSAAAARRHTQIERAHAAQQEPRLERPQDRAVAAPDLADLPPRRILVRGHQRAGDDIAVPVQIFARRVQHKVGAVRDGAGEHRRGDGGIDEYPGAARVRPRRHRGDVGHLPGRVGRGFDPHQLGAAGPHGAAHRLGVEHGQELHRRAAGARHPALEPPIHDLRRDDVIVRPERAHHRRRGRVARGEQPAPLPALERVEDRLGGLKGGVVVARISAARGIPKIGIAQIGRRRVDGGHGPARRILGRPLGLGCHRLRPHFSTRRASVRAKSSPTNKSASPVAAASA